MPTHNTNQGSLPDLAALLELKARLSRTWPAFFERYGSFTLAQVVAIPPLLDGASLLLAAPTASGKTAAVLAPLIERHCPPLRPPNQLRLLYIVPTRALASDLRARLSHPLQSLGLRLGTKTRDSSFDRTRLPDLLITTPESADSLLASNARVFAGLRAIILDELHLFDGTARGDQLRVVLNRIRRIRSYAAEQGDAPDAALQYAALSATLADPEATASRYFSAAQVVRVTGGRSIEAELIALAPDTSADLLAYLATFRARGWRKALAFCNSRAEVELYASAMRASSPFGSAVFTHYSNLEPRRRHEIEQAFAAAEAAICFTSSTLELGIDIGAIDQIILIGPPGNLASFTQRIGRGNRRASLTRAACCYRTPLERLLFGALLEELRSPPEAEQAVFAAPFRPSVAVQQIFSLLKQSPSAALRLAELTALFEGLLEPADLSAILGHLTLCDYLVAGRPGEWRAGPRLNRLYDEQNVRQVSLSIYGNIQHSSAPTVEIRDQHTGQTVARVDALWLSREQLTLEGRAVQVEWYDGEALYVVTQPGERPGEQPVYRSGRQLLSYELARRLPLQLGLALGETPLIALPADCLWFHWLGDLYGRAALDLLRYQVAAQETAAVGLALQLPDPAQVAAAWTEQQVVGYLQDSYRRYEPLLELGPFHDLLPTPLRRRAVVAQFNVPRFLLAMARLRPIPAPSGLTEDLSELLS